VPEQKATDSKSVAFASEPYYDSTMPQDPAPGWYESLPDWLQEGLPILILLVVITILISRLPKIDVGHTKAYRRRRLLNWLPLGLTYAFLYMGRYNLAVSKGAFQEMIGPDGDVLMSVVDFATIFAVGTFVYGLSFVINGPLTDRMGGRAAILIGAAGALVANLLMGVCAYLVVDGEGETSDMVAGNLTLIYSVLYATNMYFQSFGAVAIVKVNAHWFHVRERGVFGAIFGILISLGIYLAFDIGYKILNAYGIAMVYFVPAVLLAIFWTIDVFIVRNSPLEAKLGEFDPGDASSGDDGPRLSAAKVFGMMFRNPIIMTIAVIEFCSGFLRQAIMQWYRIFADHTDAVLGLQGEFVYENWGMLLCVAGITGGVIAGTLSDHVFGSRRGPVAFLLYGVMLGGAIALTFAYQTSIVGPLVIVMSMAVIGVHGMLSGTASMDFGGRRNAGTAVGLIDGFVYLGTGAMAVTYGLILPSEEEIGAVEDPANWAFWPIAMIPLALIGVVLAARIWHAFPQPVKKKSA
jgi:MFS transporter, OPA family, glycerol-3-phosphate transporter